MALKITAANEPIRIELITIGLYALPGIGKTSLAFTASRPLLLDFDLGAHRARNRKDSVHVSQWSDIAEMTKEDLADYDTIIVDTAGRALDVLSVDIIAKNPKHGNGGSLSLQGFGALKARFGGWLKLMRTYGKDVVLLAHMDEKTEGEIVKERLDVQGGSKAEIYKCVDAMAKLYVEGKSRKLDFSPREGSLGKNPAQFEVLTVPDFIKEPQYLGTIIQGIKDSINKLSEEQVKKQAAVESWREKVAAITSADGFNALIPSVKNESPEIRKMLNDAAESYGLTYDKKASAFVEMVAA